MAKIDRDAAIGVLFRLYEEAAIRWRAVGKNADAGAMIELDRAALELSRLPAEEDRPAFRWIPLSEALPEDGTWNLFTDGRRISLERYKQDAEDHFYPAGRYFDLTEAVAWMELPEQAWTLPEPYEEEQDGEGEGRSDEEGACQ